MALGLAPQMSCSGVTKSDIRQKVWDYIEEHNLANFPRPVHHRIPNFKGAYQACEYIKGLEVFSKAREVKVDPDKPLEGSRLIMLQARKTLLVPTPRLRAGLFNKIIPPPGATKEQLRICATSQGVKEYSVPVGLDASVQVDLIVVGSVAVSEKGWRIGKGEGFADMEYAMMVSMGAVSENTVVVTIVHDCQVVDIPEQLIDDHDLTVDYILTPTRIIKTDCKLPKPCGIIWSKVDTELLQRIPILNNLLYREKKAGRAVTIKNEQAASTNVVRNISVCVQEHNLENPSGSKRTVTVMESQDSRGITTVYVGNLPAGLRVSELKTLLRAHNAVPLRLTWQGAQRRAFLDYKNDETAENTVAALQNLKISGNTLRVELAKSQRASSHGGAT
ncbi:methenyltetrahydrofolate synthase domain-containing protein isoform X1 [Protopterus annectens]|uniref:methenyltetrahydrofolate synthase domain-containing protein isoform X1 n=1 Tax=Protopterus annectens TaxID=7888 RepID=UPI001CFC11FE|nr:methenyltetrahydrofolate synthase domain-containing protein isoform X1 [Protopterus annectens]